MSKWGTESEHERHQRNQEIAKHAKQSKDPSLESQCDYYRLMADTTRDAKKKAGWEQLAHQLEVRLGRVGPVWEDVGLPFE